MPKTQDQFRAEVRSYIERNWDHLAVADDQYESSVTEFLLNATEAGYWLREIPPEYGGSEQPYDLDEAIIIDEEFRSAGIRPFFGHRRKLIVGHHILVPTLLAHGSEAQKQRFIGPTVRGEIIWAQGYSEPEAGSDLASLRTKGTKKSDHWIINGHKIWTTNAASSDYMFCLCRTETEQPKRKGLSYFLVDMKSEGIRATPLHILTGAPHFGEVHLDDVRVPPENLVGNPGDGWKIANTALSAEREMVGSVEQMKSRLDSLVALAHLQTREGKTLMQDPVVQDRLISIEGFVEAHRYSVLHQIHAAQTDVGEPRLSLNNKLSSSEIGKRMAELAWDILGEDGLTPPPSDDIAKDNSYAMWRKEYLWSIAYAIAGGASNIQRDIIAERGLNLPRDLMRG